ncbi:MAG: hypothetical protein VKJ02_01830 [Snowella sp.]|nr:hypothetical protein [Snowella sp.]
MKRVGLLTTLFLFTISLGVYSRNFSITSSSLRNHTVAVFKASPKRIQQGLARSLFKILENPKPFSFPKMTKDAD